MKALLALPILVAWVASPAFAECVAPLNDVKIPNGNRVTMEQMVAANYELQANTTEVEAFIRCLKAEQAAKIDALGPDATDDVKAKISSQYVNRQNTALEKLQTLSDSYNAAELSFRAKQATAKSDQEASDETAAVNEAEKDAAAKARQEAAAQRAEERAETPKGPNASSR